MASTLIIGDIHEGKRHNVTYGDASIWDNKSLDILTRLIKEHKPLRVILAGDVFDTSKPSSLSYSRLIASLVNVEDVWIIAGNHDISKITEDIAFDNLEAVPNINIVKSGALNHVGKYNFIGWQATQELYDKALRFTIDEAQEGAVIVTHCSRLDFGNQNDNICTDEHIALAKAKDIVIISGHEHKSSISNNFIHLGSVVPHTIAETGPRYVWVDGKTIAIEPLTDVILTREEPLTIDPNKVYYIKSGKEVTVEDLKLEAKDLGIDILEDFKKKANEAGFDVQRLLND